MKLIAPFLPVFIAQCVKQPANPTPPSSFSKLSFACKCTGSSCDTFTPAPTPSYGSAAVVSTSMAGDRLTQKPNIKLTNQGRPSSDPAAIQTWSGRWLYSTQRFQNWGTTINDASAILLANLTSDAQSSLLESMFDPDTGNNIGLIRTNIGSSQFSTEPYTLDENPDPSLSNFALSSYDTEYKVPLFQKLADLGYKVSLNPVLWSPPTWMKTTGLENLGNVIPTTDNLQSLANYLLKYVEAMIEYINVFAVSPANTPVSHENGYPNVEWGLENYALYIVTYISQVFLNNFPEIKIITNEERETPTMYVENLVGLVEDSVNRYSDLDISNLAFYGVHQGFRPSLKAASAI